VSFDPAEAGLPGDAAWRLYTVNDSMFADVPREASEPTLRTPAAQGVVVATPRGREAALRMHTCCRYRVGRRSFEPGTPV
jgi:hypothetical protein